MTRLLTVSLWLSMGLFATTVGLLAAPATHAELGLWRRLRIRSLRRWISRRRNGDEPYDPKLTVQTARTNLLWHLLLTGLFSTQIAWALVSEGSWWRPLAVPLVVFCIGYFAGSLVQRQKIAIVRLRQGREHGARASGTAVKQGRRA